MVDRDIVPEDRIGGISNSATCFNCATCSTITYYEDSRY